MFVRGEAGGPPLAALRFKGGELPAYRARPLKGKKLPTVLVIQEIFGVHDYIKDVCRRLAKQGKLVLPAIAPDEPVFAPSAGV